MARCLILALAPVSVVIATVRAENGPVIAAMDELRFSPPKEKGRAELVPAKSGQAIRFRWVKESPSVFFTSNMRGTPEWDRAADFSFWVQGDGSDSLGGLQFISDNGYAVRYDLAFSIKGTGGTLGEMWSAPSKTPMRLFDVQQRHARVLVDLLKPTTLVEHGSRARPGLTWDCLAAKIVKIGWMVGWMI